MDSPEDSTLVLPEHFQVLDIRSLIANGQEPCGALKPLLSQLSPALGLRLIAPFFRAPLVEMFSAQGFHIHLNPIKDQVWTIDFWRE